MGERTLTLRELNRATLARQLLLERSDTSVYEAVARLVAMQSQIPNPPYIGLWTRLQSFQRDDLTSLMEDRRVVRAPLLRSTLHLITDADHQHFRHTIFPALERGLRSFFSKRMKDLVFDKLIAAARPFIEAEPRAMGDIRAHLLDVQPDADEAAMSYAIRTYLPLVQVPPGGTWGAGSMARYATAEQYLGQLNEAEDVPGLFRRYLAAFGPASVMDFQTWTGMTKLQAALESTLTELVTYQDEQGRTLYDLPDAAIPHPDTPAPVRFIPEYDNLLIAHADRARVVADADRKAVFLSAGRIASTVLVDGFVRATWKIDSGRKSAALTVTLLDDVSDAVHAEIMAEGERLLRFTDDAAAEYAVNVRSAS